MTVPINAFPTETVLSFLEREAAPVTTDAVASRFGWNRREAGRQLRDLERAGTIASRVEPVSWVGGGGRSKVWFIRRADSDE